MSKHSYTVSCSSRFRDAVLALAERRKANVGDLARSVMLMLPQDEIDAYVDPGEPESDDREEVILKSGPSQGRPWRRKPRLQVRMSPGLKIPFIRRALNLALAFDRGDLVVAVSDPRRERAKHTMQQKPTPVAANDEAAPLPADRAAEAAAEAAMEARQLELRDELERLRAMVAVLAFEPLDAGVHNRADALHVLGFPPGTIPDQRTLRARFRMLATIHHPDSNYGSHQRMSQLNQAMQLLKTG